MLFAQTQASKEYEIPGRPIQSALVSWILFSSLHRFCQREWGGESAVGKLKVIYDKNRKHNSNKFSISIVNFF